ncbi:YCF48-related protein [Marinimicrobium alkaliphilum]|uniref:YCF48-related protein n=1 Tax=Marinimicrobium alkaliphilum TaxID=2202654 RepID=UPI000DBA4C5D|nr:YCF48-related protein [Marinimicrobium alkaliphilum]
MHSGKKLPLTLALLCSIGVFTTACSSGGSGSDPTPPPAGSNGNSEPGDNDEPGDNEPGDDEPGDEEPGDDEPGDDEPGDDEPGDDEPGNDAPGGDEPGDDVPGDDEPGDDEPGDDEPGDDEPGDDEPGDDEPGDDEEPGTKDPGGIPDRGGDPGLPLSNWTWVYPQPVGYNLNAVMADANRFIAIGSRGSLLSSPDGELWDVQHLGGAALRAISYNGARYVVVGGDASTTSGGIIYYSDDGETWERAARDLQTGSLNAVTWTGLDFIAAGLEPDTHLRSSDGETWDKITSGPSIPAETLAAYGGTLVAGGPGALYRSLDGGDTWSAVLTLEETSGSFYALQADNDQFVAVGSASVGGFSTSPDGGDWSTEENDTAYTTNSADGRFTAVIRTGDDYWLTDRDGRVHRREGELPNWSLQSSKLASDLNGIAHLNGTFLTVGTAGALWRSDNGSDWDDQKTESMDAGNDLRALAANNGGRLVAVGDERLFYSDDGDSWSAGTIDSAGFFNTAAWTGSYYVAAGVFAIAFSTDGIEWTRSTGDIAYTFSAVAGGGNHWLALKSNPNSQDPLVSCTPASCATLDAGLDNLRQLIHDGERYWVLNGDGFVHNSDDGNQWQPAGQPLTGNARLLAATDEIVIVAANTDTQNNTRYTTDGGVTWQHASFPSNVQITGASLTSDGEGFFLYDNSRSTLWRSSDGASWSAERMPHYINSLARVGAQVFIINLNGHVLRQ